MWLVYSLITFFAWGGADLFYKKAAAGKYSHLKTSIVVGLVMGACGIVTLITTGMHYDLRNLVVYFPVSAMYILSMAIGYFGLRRLELSISSPIQNASGAVSSLLMMIVLHELPDLWSCIAILLVTAGVILLGIWERQEAVLLNSGKGGIPRTTAIGVLFPVLYCVIDSLGTFLDGLYLDDAATTPLLGVTPDTLEDTANLSYQLTFLIIALLLAGYVYIIKKQPLQLKGSSSRWLAALLETGGQLTYVHAMSGNGIVAAPVIGSYCIASVALGRIFLQEKLCPKKYAAVGLVVAGIIILALIESFGL